MKARELTRHLAGLRQLREHRAETAMARCAREKQTVGRLKEKEQKAAEGVRAADNHRRHLLKEFDSRYRDQGTNIQELLAWRQEEASLMGALEKARTRHEQSREELEQARNALNQARAESQAAYRRKQKVEWLSAELNQ